VAYRFYWLSRRLERRIDRFHETPEFGIIIVGLRTGRTGRPVVKRFPPCACSAIQETQRGYLKNHILIRRQYD